MRRILLASTLLLTSLIPAAPAMASFGQIEASPAVVPVPPSGVGTTSILWYVSGGPLFYITVNCGGPGESVFASSGEGSYSQDAPWITLGSSCTFYLRADSPNGYLLGATTVIGVGPVGSVAASPETVVIPYGSSVGTTTISWNGQNASAFHVTVQCGGGAESLFASSGPGYNSQDAPWITVGSSCLFRLRADNPYSGPEVANVTVTGQAGVPDAGVISAWPEVIEIPIGQLSGSTQISWNTNVDTAYVTKSCNGASPVFFAVSGYGRANATASIRANNSCLFEVRSGSQYGPVLDSVSVYAYRLDDNRK